MVRLKLRCVLLALSLVFACGTPSAQESTPAELAAAYRRAFTLPGIWQESVKGMDFEPDWIGGSHQFWYVHEDENGREYRLVNADTRSHRPLFDSKLLAAALSAALARPVAARQLSLEQIRLAPALDSVDFIFAGYDWHYRLTDSRLERRGAVSAAPGYWGTEDAEQQRIEVRSPDGRKLAWIEDWNLQVKDLASGQVSQLSQDGDAARYYSNRLVWSPDSSRIALMRLAPAPAQPLLLLESGPADGARPRLLQRPYPRAGDPLTQREIFVFGLDGRVLKADNTLFPDPYLLGDLRWNRKGDVLSFNYASRNKQCYRVLAMSVNDGRTSVGIEERSDTYINLPRVYRHDLGDDRQTLWTSERDNWNHLYLYDRSTGSVVRQITKGAWYVRDVIQVDEARREIVFSANGVQADDDPYLIRYYRIGFDGRGMKDLTPDRGMHQAWISRDGRYLVDRFSTVDRPPQTVLRDARSGKVVMELERVDISALKAAGWKAPEVFSAKGRDGVTDIWGLLVTPSNFDPARRYPVIESIYASPGGQHVPKSFTPGYWWMSGLAELGFVVVQIDGMGTSFRSRKFENVAWMNLADAGLPDRIAWIKAAAQTRPWMDIERVGIFGASAGGQSAMGAVLFHPEFYKAAFAASGSHDNRLDKRWWNEQWMGYPVGPQYAQSSNIDNAWRLTRPLMLLVGELDDNVDPASTLRVASALIRADKAFELVFLPGTGHTLGGRYGDHKRYDFFVRTLMLRTPPDWPQTEGAQP